MLNNSEYDGASIIDEPSDTLTYIGYAADGNPAETEEKWAIKRIEKLTNVTRIMWVNGIIDRSFVWNDRASYTYKFRI